MNRHWLYSFRAKAFFGATVSIGFIVIAIVLQHVNDLVPCHLCMFQRAAYALLAATLLLSFAVGIRHVPKWMHVILSLIPACMGLGLAARQVWLQHLPADQAPSCGATLNYMIEVLPWNSVIARVLSGTGECAVVDWSMLGLSMAAWSFIAFFLLTIWILFLGCHKVSKNI